MQRSASYTRPMRATAALVVSAALLPFCAVPELLERAADRAGNALGRELAALARPLSRREAPSATLDPLPTPAPPELAHARLPNASARKLPSSRLPPIQARLLTRASVLELAQRRIIPDASPVPANGDRPAGLSLRGVEPLKLGLVDGDLLVEVMGAPVRSVEEVVALVLAARARRDREISARVWTTRGALTLVVEQPYDEEAAPQGRRRELPGR
jgi:hypothetical protein